MCIDTWCESATGKSVRVRESDAQTYDTHTHIAQIYDTHTHTYACVVSCHTPNSSSWALCKILVNQRLFSVFGRVYRCLNMCRRVYCITEAM